MGRESDWSIRKTCAVPHLIYLHHGTKVWACKGTQALIAIWEISMNEGEDNNINNRLAGVKAALFQRKRPKTLC